VDDTFAGKSIDQGQCRSQGFLRGRAIATVDRGPYGSDGVSDPATLVTIASPSYYVLFMSFDC
jgi:hypothetical protein